MEQLLKAVTELIRTLTDLAVELLDILQEQKEHERIEHDERMHHLGQQVSEAEMRISASASPRVRRRTR